MKKIILKIALGTLLISQISFAQSVVGINQNGQTCSGPDNCHSLAAPSLVDGTAVPITTKPIRDIQMNPRGNTSTQ